MSSISMRQLEDRAKDVDPDLRYMALEDFQKFLTVSKTPQLQKVVFFVPILFQLLNDSATEVQNQAVKSFAPLIYHLDDENVAKIIADLYSKVEATANDSKFSTSVPTLALRGIFSDSNSRFNQKLSRAAFDTLLPRIFAANMAMTIDKIEICIDTIKSLGSALSFSELLSLATSLISAAFKEKGIIGKRSIIAVDACLGYVPHASHQQTGPQVQFYDKVIQDIVSLYKQSPDSAYSSDVFFTLLQVILAQAGASNAVSDSSMSSIFQAVLCGLELDKLADEVDAEDLDIDELMQTNVVRENALITLSHLVPCFSADSFLHHYASQVFAVIEKFIDYDPLAYGESDDEADVGEESELDFSDDEEIEQFETTGENDALAAKLRLLALLVTKKMLQNLLAVLLTFLSEGIATKVIERISDKSEVVSNEAISTSVVLIRQSASSFRTTRHRSNSDVSMATESCDQSPYSVVAREYTGLLEDKILSILLTPKHLSRFLSTKVLIESIIVEFAQDLSDSFLDQFSQALSELKLSSKTFPEIVKTYKVILECYDFSQIPVDLIDYMIDDLGESLMVSSTYHSVVADVLLVCGALYKKAPPTPKYASIMNTRFFPAIVQNLRKKEFSGDIRQRLLESLADLIIHVDLSAENSHEAVSIFQESFNHEVAVSFAIETMIRVCERKPQLFESVEFCQTCVEKLTVYLGSSDSSMYLCSLSLMNMIFEKTNFTPSVEKISALRDILFDLMKGSNDYKFLGKCLLILGHSMKSIPADEAFILSLFTQVINEKFSDSDDFDLKPLEYLITQVSTYNQVGGKKLFAFGRQTLILKNFISAKVMASVCLDSGLDEEILGIEKELFSYIQAPNTLASPDIIVFDIHFLGCIAAHGVMKNISFADLFEIPKKESNDQICLAAARAMGLYISRDLGTHMPILLRCYQEASLQNDEKRVLYLVAFKQLLREGSSSLDISALRNIWEGLFHVISTKLGQLTHKEVLELKLAGDVLSSVTKCDADGEYQRKFMQIIDGIDGSTQREHLLYTVVVIMKNNLAEASEDYEVVLIERILPYLAVNNLELKLAIVSTLLTGIYNKSEAFAPILNTVILPAIYQELSAKEEFKKIIPMGPYKYVVDEGLEVRKLSYELISAILNLNNSKVHDASRVVDEVKVFEVLLEKGLKDQENEIINSTVENLIQIIRKNDGVLGKMSNQQEMIASLSKIMNRKLRSKASTQETEGFEDTLRSIIKLSKVLNEYFARTKSVNNEWMTYYQELKSKHHILFSAVDS